jgi:hypothetical protein
VFKPQYTAPPTNSPLSKKEMSQSPIYVCIVKRDYTSSAMGAEVRTGILFWLSPTYPIRDISTVPWLPQIHIPAVRSLFIVLLGRLVPKCVSDPE